MFLLFFHSFLVVSVNYFQSICQKLGGGGGGEQMNCLQGIKSSGACSAGSKEKTVKSEQKAL